MITMCGHVPTYSPMHTRISTLNLGGRDCKSLTLMHNPIKVAMEQCSTVGVKKTRTTPARSSTIICSWDTTDSYSNVYGCSGSVMSLMCSKISYASMSSRSSSAVVNFSLTSCFRWWSYGFGLISSAMASTKN